MNQKNQNANEDLKTATLTDLREIEQSLIKCLIFRPGLVAEYSPLLSPKLFIYSDHAADAQSIIDYHEGNKPDVTDGPGIMQGMLDSELFTAKSLVAYGACNAPLLYAPRYFMEVFKAWTDRYGEELRMKGMSHPDVGDMISREQIRFESIMSMSDGSKMTSGRSAAIVLAASAQGAGELPGITTGLKNLDKVTQGMQAGQSWVVAGRSGMGKTSFALSLMISAAKNGKRALYYSTEMLHEQITAKILCNLSGIKPAALASKKLNKDEWKQLEAASGEIERMDYAVNDGTDTTIEAVVAQARAMKDELDIVFIDYLQQLSTTDKKDSREQEVATISRKAKKLALELSIPVILVSQLNRQVEARASKRPISSDLRESGAIEQDADVILLLFREGYYEPMADQFLADAIVDKNRGGMTGEVPFIFTNNFTGIANV